jgi:hypothetical protein
VDVAKVGNPGISGAERAGAPRVRRIVDDDDFEVLRRNRLRAERGNSVAQNMMALETRDDGGDTRLNGQPPWLRMGYCHFE